MRPLSKPLACSAALLAGTAGCGERLAAPIPAAHETDSSPRRGGTLRLAWLQDIRNLDPAGPADGYALQAMHLLFAGLVDFDDRGSSSPSSRIIGRSRKKVACTASCFERASGCTTDKS